MLFIISEIVEALSLSNKPRQLLDTTLDTLMNTKNIHSCWIKLLLAERDKLQLTTHRNYTKKMIKDELVWQQAQKPDEEPPKPHLCVLPKKVDIKKFIQIMEEHLAAYSCHE